MAKEVRAHINELLEESGWRYFNGHGVCVNIRLEANIQLTEHALNELGEDF